VSDTEGRRLRDRFPQRGRWLFTLGFFLGLSVGAIFAATWTRRHYSPRLPDFAARSSSGGHLPAEAVESSMEEVLEIARNALAHMREHLDDYTATLVKQESLNGALGEAHQMAIKVQCRHRGGNVDETEPFRVYMRFEHPPSVAGREVIWAEDIYDGKMVVHEGGLLGLMTLRLDPLGMVAMRGQKYPISEIGMTNLVKKLIERGEPDRDNPDVTVTITSDWEMEGQICDLIEVRRRTPSGQPDDFWQAEICFDRIRHLPLRYTAYGWPPGSPEAADLSTAPILESYTYLDVQTNVGLTEADFDFRNPAYRFR
jgi:hypothetical protein